MHLHRRRRHNSDSACACRSRAGWQARPRCDNHRTTIRIINSWRLAPGGLSVKFGLFYQLPCAPDQSEPARYNETVEQVILADEIGFDTAWLAELHFFRPFSIMPAPLIVATAIAQRTKRIRLGTGVSLLPFHHPLKLAAEAAVVDILSDGRLDLGVGRGTIAVHFQGFDVPRDESRERFEEALEI